jgi:hypothetical protein
VTATVYAVDRVKHGVARHAEIAALSESHGEIPVVPFDIPEPNVEDPMRHAFKNLSIRLVTQPSATTLSLLPNRVQPRT